MLGDNVDRSEVLWVEHRKISLYAPPPYWWWYARVCRVVQNKSFSECLLKLLNKRYKYSGNWDKKAVPFLETHWYRIIKNLHANRIKYKNSIWYKSAILQIDKKGFYEYKKQKIYQRKELDVFFENYLLEIFDSIRLHGWIGHNNEYPKAYIGRDGNLIKTGNGCHRLAIFKVLNTNHLFPIKIVGVHKKLSY